MATGGLGGVHRGAAQTFDESADLTALSRTRVLVVASGVEVHPRRARDAGAPRDLGVPVASVGQRRFAGFYVRDSGVQIGWSVETPEDAARAFLAHLQLGRGGMLLANPIPAGAEMDPALHARVLADGLHDAHESGIGGADVTPFLLAHFASESGGESVAANVALVLSNAALAARVAAAIAAGD